MDGQTLHAGRLYEIPAYGDKLRLKLAWSESRDPFFKILPQSYLLIVLSNCRS